VHISKKQLRISIALCLGTLIAFNVYLVLRMDSVPRLMIRQLRQQPKVDMLFLGNSLMASGLDQQSFTSTWSQRGTPPALYNASLPGSSTVEQDLFAREAFRDHKAIKYVVYGFFNDQLTKIPHASWDGFEGNMAMSYYIEPDIAAKYYFPNESILEKWSFRLIGLIPMLRERSQLWKYVEQVRRTLSGMGMPAITTTRFGRASDFDKVGLIQPDVLDRIYDEAVEKAAPFAPPFEEICQLTATNGARLYVVEMPVPSKHRSLNYSSLSWLKYREFLQKQLSHDGIVYISANDWVTDDKCFLDAIHLNEMGAKVFSDHLAKKLIDLIKP